MATTAVPRPVLKVSATTGPERLVIRNLEQASNESADGRPEEAELAKRQGQGDTGDAGGRPAAAENLSPSLASHLEEIDTRFMAEAKEAATARQKAQSAAAAPASPAMTVEPIAERPAGTGKPLRTTGAVDARSQQAEKAAAQDKSAAQNLFAAKQVDKPPARKVFAIVVGTITVLAICGIGGYFWWQLQPKTSLVASRTPSPPAMPVPPAAPPVAVPPAPTATAAATACRTDSRRHSRPGFRCG
jgi:hypothetical protein